MDARAGINQLLSRESLTGQFLRYLVVGAIATVVDIGLFVLLTDSVGVHYLVSNSISFCAGLSVNYALSVVWVFSARTLTNRKAEFLVFAAVGLAGLGWNELLLYVGKGIVGLDHHLSKAIAVILVLFWNFGMRKVMLFRSTAKSCNNDDRQDREDSTVGSQAKVAPSSEN